MGAVLSSIPLCSRAQAPGGDTAETDQRPEERQETGAVTVLDQPLPVQLQTNTPETCTATGIDNENHQEMTEEEKTEPAQEVEELQPPTVEEASQQPQQEEVEDGSVEVTPDDSQSDEWSLEKEEQEEV